MPRKLRLTFAIPPFCTIAIQRMSRGPSYGDVFSGDREKGPRLFFIAPSCLALKDYLIKVNKS
jgi:hypothetical protein